MNKPIRPKNTPPDIPSKVADRPRYAELTPDEERAFLAELAEFEAAYRQTADPLPWWEALRLVERSGQTVPHWLAMPFYEVFMRLRTGDEARRYSERAEYARRYECVRDQLRELEAKGLKKRGLKKRAVNAAHADLKGDYAGDRSCKTIENAFDIVKKDLEKWGRESQYYFFIADRESKGY